MSDAPGSPSEGEDDNAIDEKLIGWHDWHGGKRYFDGREWTDHYAYVPPKGQQLGFWEIAAAAALGVLAALFIVWAGAQVEPDTFYYPIKVVVEEAPDF